MKLLIVGDLHIHPHFGDWRKVDDGLEVLDWVFETAVKLEVQAVVFLGDVFHVRGYVYPSILARVYRQIALYRDVGIEPIFVVGNHDMPFKDSTKDHSLTTFSSVATIADGILVHEFPQWRFIYAPYVEDYEALQKALDEVFVQDEKKTVLFGHLDIIGAAMNNTTASIRGIPLEYFQKYHQVFTGHYHKKQLLGDNVLYVGTPYQINFNEEGQEKSIVFWNDGDYILIPNDFSPRHMTLKIEELDRANESDYVRVVLTGSAQMNDLQKILENRSFRDVKVIINHEEFQASKTMEISESIDAKDIVRQWVATIDTDRPKERILQVGLELLEAARDQV